ncbi:MAG TPA: polyphosphate kinase 2 family protein [Verrucomicrobiae bacterium]|jgi:PPK2 family polyphosphate:nucleotide phosphotransferase|nr:polyphosphate kinase 2 family protein [Verrucomicrobiae bacterium]
MGITLKDLSDRYRVCDGKKFRLKDFDPHDTWKLKSKEHANELLQHSLERLAEMQGRLYAQNEWALLLIFQAIDAAGKDGTIKHVMSGINPQGCEVYSFKAPSTEELDHDFLWRCARRLPERGHIGIFNRSYYEETLVVRIHKEFLGKQKLPSTLVTKHLWKERFEDIASFERYLGRNGIIVRKFFLNVSKKEQKERFLRRLDDPARNWKFSPDDVRERQHWPEYMDAYQDTICHTATEDAPWYVIPADHKWFTRLVVASVIVETLDSLKLKFPKVSPEIRKEFAAARAALMKEK